MEVHILPLAKRWVPNANVGGLVLLLWTWGSRYEELIICMVECEGLVLVTLARVEKRSRWLRGASEGCHMFNQPFWPHLREIWPIKHPFFLAPLHASINIIYVKPKTWRNVVVGTVFLLHAYVSWRECAMYILHEFSPTWMSSICIQHLLFLGWIW